jgi:hypothetical protein
MGLAPVAISSYFSSLRAIAIMQILKYTKPRNAFIIKIEPARIFLEAHMAKGIPCSHTIIRHHSKRISGGIKNLLIRTSLPN